MWLIEIKSAKNKRYLDTRTLPTGDIENALSFKTKDDADAYIAMWQETGVFSALKAIEVKPKPPAPTNKVSFDINNCLDCPHSKEIRDPSSADSFDFHDASLCCTITPLMNAFRTKTDLGETIPGRYIVACERRIRREQTSIPEWCPLIKKTEPAK